MKNRGTKLVYSTNPDVRQHIQDEKNSQKNIPIKNESPESQSIKVLLQTKGRRGKTVTVIQGFKHDFEMLTKLARELKQYCGAGGTVKGQDIEIQGDKRKQVVHKLSDLGYRV